MGTEMAPTYATTTNIRQKNLYQIRGKKYKSDIKREFETKEKILR